MCISSAIFFTASEIYTFLLAAAFSTDNIKSWQLGIVIFNISFIKKFTIKGESNDGFISINEDCIVEKDIFEFEKEEGYYDINEIFEKGLNIYCL